MKKVYAIAIIVILSLTIVALLAYIQSLTSRVASLEEQAALQMHQASEFKRSYCSNSFSVTKENTVTRYALKSAGYDRTYQVHTPKNYDPSVRYPVIVSFDGIEGSGSRIESYSNLDTLPVIAVYPDSLPGKQGFTAWQGAPYSLDGDYDVQFVRDLLDTLPSQYCIDSTKTFAVGMSNGGGFAAIAGCRLSDKFQAIVGVSGAYYAACKEPGRSVSFLAIHSVDDIRIPFAGSEQRRLPDITQWAQSVAAGKQCKILPQNRIGGGEIYYDWTGCKDGSLVRLVVVKGQKHGWLEVSSGASNLQTHDATAQYIWQFFQESLYREEN